MERQTKNLITTDSFNPAAPTKRMIVEENAAKGKIFFRLAIERRAGV
jgi:hypothetical protein